MELDAWPIDPAGATRLDPSDSGLLTYDGMDYQQRQQVKSALARPRFLFRAASAKSRGKAAGNNRDIINPLASYVPAPGLRLETSAFVPYYFWSMDWDAARYMLATHFDWDYERPSAFSSWSLSLLWVLVHAVRKAVVNGEQDVLIYVLDTAKLKDSDRIFRATSLIDIFGLSKRPRPEDTRKNARGEYLIYGELCQEDGFTAASLNELIDAGLFEYAPKLNVAREKGFRTKQSGKMIKRERRVLKRQRLEGLVQRYHAVARLYFCPRHERSSKFVNSRIDIGDDGLEVWKSELSHVFYWRTLGECFGDDFASTMTIAFACLRRRKMSWEVKEELFRQLDGLNYSYHALSREDRSEHQDAIDETIRPTPQEKKTWDQFMDERKQFHGLLLDNQWYREELDGDVMYTDL